MTQEVDVPGVGRLQFPDGMSHQDMSNAIKKNFPDIHQEQKEQPNAYKQFLEKGSVAAERFGGGEVTEKLSRVGVPPKIAAGAGVAADIIPGMLGGNIGGAVGKAVATPVAEHMMSKAISPTTFNMSVREAENLTKTALEQGIDVTKGGVQKLRGMLRDLGGKAENIISTSTAKISPRDILKDLKSPEAKAEFRKLRMATKGGDIPIQAAQKTKQEISRRLSDYSYRDIQLGGKSARVEGMQELQKVLRENIAKIEPSVKELNQKMHELFNLRPHLERQVVKNMRSVLGTAPLSSGARATQALGQTAGTAIGATAGQIGQQELNAPADR